MAQLPPVSLEDASLQTWLRMRDDTDIPADSWITKRSESAFRTAKLPEDIVRTFYFWDGYNPAQLRYSAFDRNRLLWRCDVSGDGFDLVSAAVPTTRTPGSRSSTIASATVCSR